MLALKRSTLLFALLIVSLIVVGNSGVRAESLSSVKEQAVKVKFRIGTQEAIVRLNESSAAKGFAAQLPLTLTFKDYASIEKISYLPVKLSIQVTSGTRVQSEGDFAYYAPWGNIAIFYKGSEKATSDLHILGKFESGKEIFDINNSFEATVEVAK